MFTFEKIFEKEFQIENDDYIKRNVKGDTFVDVFTYTFSQSNILLFTHHFTYTPFKTSNRYSWEKYIKYKFFILSHFLQSNCNYIDEAYKERILSIFSNTQKHIMALYRFKNICLFKTKKYLGQPQDLQFNLLSEVSPIYTIDIIQSGIKYNFLIFDLIRIINTSLSYEYNFFTDPKHIKNPWNNVSFSKINLYNIYFFIKNTTTCINMPILFSRFFQSNFCLTHFEDHNQLIIKQYIIENCHTFNNVKKLSHIYNMIEMFNSKRIKYRINIADGFPENVLLKIMEPYLKTYLLANYSYEDTLLIRYRNILTNKLREFHKNNMIFGRKIISLQLQKMYYLSCLYYNEKIELFLPDNVYLPIPELISLDCKCYYIGQNHHSIFSTTPNFNFENDNKKLQRPLDIRGIIPIIKNYIFTDEQKIIIQEKYQINKPERIELISVNTNITENITENINDISNNSNEYDESEPHLTFDTYTIDDLSNNELEQFIELLNLDQLMQEVSIDEDDDEDEFENEDTEEDFMSDDSV